MKGVFGVQFVLYKLQFATENATATLLMRLISYGASSCHLLVIWPRQTQLAQLLVSLLLFTNLFIAKVQGKQPHVSLHPQDLICIMENNVVCSVCGQKVDHN